MQTYSGSNTMNTLATTPSQTDNCITIGWNTTIPWDNPQNLISLETEILIDKVKAAIIIPILYVIGLPANVINMVVFFKQGLNERINLCLFLLAMADLICLTYIFILNFNDYDGVFTNSKKYGMIYVYMINNNVTGLSGFSYVSLLISTVIATERCICVLFPLQAQRCISTKIFAVMLIISMCVLGFLRFVVTAKYWMACFYEVRTGRRSWQFTASDYYLQNKEMLTVLDGIFYGFFLLVGAPVIVLIMTVVTSIKLQQIIRWRDRASSSISSKEIGVTKMLIFLSVEFLIFLIPGFILRVLPMFIPQLNPSGHYANAFLVCLNVANLCTFMSSCVNFFVYYFTGSRYRETLHQLLRYVRSNIMRIGTESTTKAYK